MKKLLTVISLAISLVFGLVAIPVFAQQSPVSVNIANHAFSPMDLTIPAGTLVTWTNNDSAIQRVTPDLVGNITWGSGDLSPGQSYSFTLNTPAVYDYHDYYYPWMMGRIVVQADSGAGAVTILSTTTPPGAIIGVPSTGGSPPAGSGSFMTFLFLTAAVGAFGSGAIGLRVWSRGRPKDNGIT